jgi:hypothetical protein
MYPLPGNVKTGAYIHTFLLGYFCPLGRMPHFSLHIFFLILIQSGKRGKLNYTIHGKIVMPEHTYIHFYIDRLGVESILGPLGTAATPGLLYLPRVIVRMAKLVE